MTLIFCFATPIESCLPGEQELQKGESVKLSISPKNPDWPSQVSGVLDLPASSNSYGDRCYQITFDETVFGATLPEPCDFINVSCYGCCDQLREDLNNWNPLRDNGDGTGTIINFDGTEGPNVTLA